MSKLTRKQVKRDAKSVSAARRHGASAPVSGLQNPPRQEENDLSAAQSEYLESMRLSVQQMKECDGRPLSELLGELRAETMGNDQTHQDD